MADDKKLLGSLFVNKAKESGNVYMSGKLFGDKEVHFVAHRSKKNKDMFVIFEADPPKAKKGAKKKVDDDLLPF